ncbi:MAG: hypothetical protein U0457_08160 [Candidatus Sericytochromatia bacterium]
MLELLKETTKFIKQKKGLYTVPIWFFLITELIFSETSFWAVIIIFIANIIVNVGWINQIKTLVVEKKEQTTMDDFFIGVGKYFSVTVNGITSIGLSAMTLLVIISKMVDYITNLDELKIKKIQEVQKAFSQQKTVEDLMLYVNNLDIEVKNIFVTWSLGLLAFIIIITTIYFIIGLWMNVAIIKDVGFFQSCKKSSSLVKNKFGVYTFFATLQAFYQTFIMTAPFFVRDNFFAQILLLILNITTDTFFTVLFCLFVFKYLNGEDNNALQPSLSEIQKPSNKE